MGLLFLVLIGLGFGSFANVCIYRWPTDGSVFRPHRSFCPWCQKLICWYDNIPLLSFLLLKGRCRRCHSIISWRYPLIEVTIPILWVIFYTFIGPITWANFIFHFTVYFFIWIVVVTTATDLDWKLIPDEASYSLLIFGIITSPMSMILGENLPAKTSIQSSILGALAGGLFLFIIASFGKKILKKEVLGWGDIKLLAGIGSILGPKGALFTIFLASLIGSTFACLGLLFKTIKRNQYIAFGPFINVAALIALSLLLKHPEFLEMFY